MKFFAYTDGACSGNPGPGGWGVLLEARSDDTKTLIRSVEFYGSAVETTNNQMELEACIRALRGLLHSVELTIFTDSKYVVDGITKWVPGWKSRGWRKADGEPVKNLDLWKSLDELCHIHKVRWQWVKGHASNPGNIRADKLAVQGRNEALDKAMRLIE